VGAKRGKGCQPVAVWVAHTAAGRVEWARFVGPILKRTLKSLLGPHAPLEVLLDRALHQAAAAWPQYRRSEPLSIWAQRLAAAVALRHVNGLRSSGVRASSAPERAGGMREVLAHVHRKLLELRPEEHFVFALLELDGRSVTEVAAVLGAAPGVVRERASRARRRLFFAVREDALLTRYICVAERWRALARLEA
jgi:DNA-directed RNA polymerase specialized sigma24 family protein